MFSEQQFIEKPADLAKMIAKVLQLGLEGLVLKDLESIYEPGKRHWLKVKKDYLFDGAMADTADLVVLGAWFGTGKKGGMMSVFLMGCLDTNRNCWVTVTKVHTGHDDSTLERLQKELAPLMVKISQEFTKLPHWLDCNKGMVPDFIAKDPKNQPVWEITGTELTKANLHTADGISVRFPRVTRIRDDKDWKTATTLKELKELYNTSKEKTDVSLLNKLAATAADDDEPPRKKLKASPSKTSPSKRNETKSPISKNNLKIDKFFTKKISPNKRKANNFNESDTIDTVSDICGTDNDEVETKHVGYQLLPENPLPDAFLDKKIGFYPDFISIPEDERRHLERHWIAYGGDVVKSLKFMDVDYVVHIDSSIEFMKMQKLLTKIPPGVRHVTKDWLTKCIKKVKLCDTKKFAVTVLPP
ncbi:unnamed protein product, partial [Iphiclides podalirius]